MLVTGNPACSREGVRHVFQHPPRTLLILDATSSWTRPSSNVGVPIAADDPANLVIRHSFESALPLVRNLTRKQHPVEVGALATRGLKPFDEVHMDRLLRREVVALSSHVVRPLLILAPMVRGVFDGSKTTIRGNVKRSVKTLPSGAELAPCGFAEAMLQCIAMKSGCGSTNRWLPGSDRLTHALRPCSRMKFSAAGECSRR